MVTGLTSCGQKSDWATIEEQGYFTCGITVYKPMNYFDDEGNLIGFDTEFAQAVAKELGWEARFLVINWPDKYEDLNSGVIDLIWNGFTYGMERNGISRTDYVNFTYPYLENQQCLISKTDKLDELKSADAFKGKIGVAESGSSGHEIAINLVGIQDNILTVASQREALLKLISAPNIDFAIIDYQMAKSTIGTGEYEKLSINTAVQPATEYYSIGCRKGSDLVAKINEAIKTLSENGTLSKIAEKYGLSDDLIPHIGSN